MNDPNPKYTSPNPAQGYYQGPPVMAPPQHTAPPPPRSQPEEQKTDDSQKDDAKKDVGIFAACLACLCCGFGAEEVLSE
ncbi:uncharacterized protein LOC114258018 isoform X9 [Camellia sinensis]|uniref:uncharacterized protein LOC114258018 isoform X9 n=1 Tax=Camellia sinensis TaxID=4442 RepID=UPI001035910D|nr:uncharacterized protein LOC114258018 isoform X9 [Camellia sinensis]